jgi:hypothetical protein
MPLVVESPYENLSGSWLRGNLHTHTTESDGAKTPGEAVAFYDSRGYDFLALSDHDLLTPPPDNFPHRMVFLQGNEITSNGPHLLHIGATKRIDPDADRAKVVREVMAAEGLCILNHPSWGFDCVHWSQEELENLYPYHGIEVYNSVVRRLEGSCVAADRWDRLLGKGIRVWGYAHDDAHIDRDFGNACNWVRTPDPTPAGILAALKAGHCYASTGVELTELSTQGDRARIVSRNGSVLKAIVDWGIEAARLPGRSWDLDIRNLVSQWRPSYVRFEILGDAEATAWTQPLFLKWD